MRFLRGLIFSILFAWHHCHYGNYWLAAFAFAATGHFSGNGYGRG